MNQSTNYNFNLPEGTDLVNLLTQLIPNWSNLDTILKGVQDATFQNATETVSLGVHAITRLTPGAKLLKWVATGNFEAGETFTIDGISTPAALPSGESLGNDAYITGAVVIAALNSDESALTVYVTSGTQAVALDSERLGGELPAYYATKSYADGIKTTADNAATAISLKNLVNTFYDTNDSKMYIVNSDGTQGGEINMSRALDYTNGVEHNFSGSQTNTTFTCSVNGELFYSLEAPKLITINGKSVLKSAYGSSGAAGTLITDHLPISVGDVVVFTAYGDGNQGSLFTEVPYK